MKTVEKKNILISVPVPLLKKLDTAARTEKRSRTAEVCVRLAESLKNKQRTAGVANESIDEHGVIVLHAPTPIK